MAAGRDIKRDRIRQLRQQAERNRVANEEAERRRTEAAEAVRNVHHRRSARQTPATVDGHRITYDELKDIPFGSGAAEKLARKEGLTWEDFVGHESSGKKGYTTGDVRYAVEVHDKKREEAAEADLEAEARAGQSGVKMDASVTEDKMEPAAATDNKG